MSGALAHCKQRMLLLGADGSGKTTTLLKFAQQAAQERLADPLKPLPIWDNIHTWKEGQSIIEWLQSTLDDHDYKIKLSSHDCIYFLDGLDGLSMGVSHTPDKQNGKYSDPRLKFIKAVRTELFNSQYIVTCREDDFRTMGEPATFGGAVTLLELSEDQIKTFLTQNRHQPKLWEVLEKDSELLNLARTPVMLMLLSSSVEKDASQDDIDKITRKNVFAYCFEKRFRIEKSRDNNHQSLQINLKETADILSRIAAYMWRQWWSPEQSVSLGHMKTLVEESIKAERLEGFLDFVRRMQLISKDTPSD